MALTKLKDFHGGELVCSKVSSYAVLALADGNVFTGRAIGASGISVGEVVFNTAMTGYQEILTDASYARQIITLTYPHVGNVGTNNQDEESDYIWASGLVVRDLPMFASNFRNEQSLGAYLCDRNVVAISDIDTRKLTRILRKTGSQNGCIIAGSRDADKAVACARDFAGLEGMDLAKEVSILKPKKWYHPSWRLGMESPTSQDASYRVVAYDFGVKYSILRMLVDRGCSVTIVPAQTPVSEVLAMKPDGVFLSNGPGDPEPCYYAIDAIKTLLDRDIPIFGICLGHQLLALASGATTKKMKFGHHGANHPVYDVKNDRVLITSQNHGFAVDEASIPSNLVVTHRSLFDGSLQGIERIDKLAFSFQGHPEASPGPHDAALLFDRFIQMMESVK